MICAERQVGHDLPDQDTQRLGQDDGLPPEPQQNPICPYVDIFKPEAGDGGEALGIEDDQKTSDPVFWFERCVVQKRARVLPSTLGVDGDGERVQIRSSTLRGAVPPRMTMSGNTSSV